MNISADFSLFLIQFLEYYENRSYRIMITLYKVGLFLLRKYSYSWKYVFSFFVLQIISNKRFFQGVCTLIQAWFLLYQPSHHRCYIWGKRTEILIFLKGNRGQGNNNSINKNFLKFTYKPQLAYTYVLLRWWNQ